MGTGLGVDHIQLNLRRQLQTNRIAVVFVQLDQRPFHQEVQGVPDHLVREGEGFVGFLVQKVRTIFVAVQVGGRAYLQVGLLELITRLECLLEHGAGKQVSHLQAHQGLATASGWGRDLRFHAAVRGVFELEERLTLDVYGINQYGHVSCPCGRGDRESLVSGLRSLPSPSCVRRDPCPASFWGRSLRVRYTMGSGWQSRAYPASAQTLRSRRRRPGWGMP